MNKPDFFIVGAPKTGTTALYSYLKEHPEIFMPEIKELHYFGSDLRFNTTRRSEEDYLSHFISVKNEKRIGEASVRYLSSKKAAVEIKAWSPLARIIIMLRNPVDTIHSLHSQTLYNGNENIQELEAALDAERYRKLGIGIPQTAFLIDSLFYRETVRYSEQVERYFKVFGRDKVRVIIFDDFINNTTEVYRETLRFLNVEETFQQDFPIINSNKIIRNNLLRDFLRYPPAGIQRFGRTFIPPVFRQQFKKKIMRLNTKHVERAPMNNALKHKLRNELRPEIEKLSKLLDRDLTSWIQ